MTLFPVLNSFTFLKYKYIFFYLTSTAGCLSMTWLKAAEIGFSITFFLWFLSVPLFAKKNRHSGISLDAKWSIGDALVWKIEDLT